MGRPSCSSSMRKASWPCGLSSSTERASTPAAAGVLDDGVALVQRVEDVAHHADREHGAADLGHGRVDALPAPAEVVQVHRLGEEQVRVGVEAAHELVAVVLEVALHLEPLPQREAVERLHDLTSEAAREDVVAAERDLADHASQGQPLVRSLAGVGVVVVAAAPARVHVDHAPSRRPPRDLLRARGRGGGDRHDRTDPLREDHRPLQRLHAAHRAADHAVPPLDAEVVGQLRLAAHPVPHGHHREPAPPRLAVVGVGAGRSGAALAAAEHVRRTPRTSGRCRWACPAR